MQTPSSGSSRQTVMLLVVVAVMLALGGPDPAAARAGTLLVGYDRASRASLAHQPQRRSIVQHSEACCSCFMNVILFLLVQSNRPLKTSLATRAAA